MASIRGLLSRLAPGTRGERLAVAIGLALALAFGISLLRDPSPTVTWVLGGLLVALIVAQTLYGMGWRFGWR